MSDKPKFAMYWSAACGGCEIAVLNTHEKILAVDANFEVAFWPVAMDAKYKDVEAMPDKSILLTLFNGAIRNNENAHIARLLRRKSQLLVAFGACATMGGIPALANLGSTQAIFDTAYHTLSTENPNNVFPQAYWNMPEGELSIPELYPVVKSLNQVVPVDYYMPGCPPESHQIAAVIDLVIHVIQGQAELPPKGAVIGAGNASVCEDCRRTRHEKKIKQFVRIQDIQPDPTLCLLEQGVLCNGPATRGGCGALCPTAGMPCGGCYGPVDGVIDQGARLLSAVASVIDARDPKEVEKILDGIPDPAGMFYRFGMAGSVLKHAKT
jgi:F420-non-reducing hydrogenase small subunit